MLVGTSRLKGLQKDWRQKCKRREFKNGFLIVVGLLVEFLLYFLLTNKWLLLAVIIALDIFLLVVIRLLIRDVEITNVEKIQEASSIAEQSLDYVVNEVPGNYYV